jgi:pimeloyl-ACP methyl ester carboxylesterase
MHTLARDFCVIALDCRGHGKSDKPHDASKYGNEMIEDVARRGVRSSSRPSTISSPRTGPPQSQ